MMLPVTIKATTKRRRRLLVEVDAERLEQLAAAFGFFHPDILKSIDRAEKDYQAGRVRKIRSLRELRRRT